MRDYFWVSVYRLPDSTFGSDLALSIQTTESLLYGHESLCSDRAGHITARDITWHGMTARRIAELAHGITARRNAALANYYY